MEDARVIQQEIEDLLRQKIGLNPESVGSTSIFRAVKKGMRTGKMQGLSDYLSSLRSSPKSFEALVESIVVPETSFFRNRASFVFLRQWLAQEWRGKDSRRMGNQPLRILSLPCSTGEEPYSIAITLLEEGLDLDDFHIDAVDISSLAIAKAKAGIYSPYAFRRQTYRSDDKYFALGIPEGTKGKHAAERYVLIESVRQKISFTQGNVLNPTLLANALPYDIVFCRNLLIYFDKAARDHATTRLDRLLKPHGLLFVGYAETGLVDSTRYKLVPYPQTFAFRKQKGSLLHHLSPCESIELPDALDNVGTKLSFPYDPSLKENHPEQTIENCALQLNTARDLADKGEIEASVIQCDRYLQMCPADAQAHLLRGELYAATGENAAAEAYFKKAVYLNPQLIEALTHLMLLKAEQQKLDEVAVIRDRIQRLATLEL